MWQLKSKQSIRHTALVFVVLCLAEVRGIRDWRLTGLHGSGSPCTFSIDVIASAVLHDANDV